MSARPVATFRNTIGSFSGKLVLETTIEGYEAIHSAFKNHSSDRTMFDLMKVQEVDLSQLGLHDAGKLCLFIGPEILETDGHRVYVSLRYDSSSSDKRPESLRYIEASCNIGYVVCGFTQRQIANSFIPVFNIERKVLQKLTLILE